MPEALGAGVVAEAGAPVAGREEEAGARRGGGGALLPFCGCEAGEEEERQGGVCGECKVGGLAGQRMDWGEVVAGQWW